MVTILSKDATYSNLPLSFCPTVLVSPIRDAPRKLPLVRQAAAEAGKATHPAVSGREDGRVRETHRRRHGHRNSRIGILYRDDSISEHIYIYTGQLKSKAQHQARSTHCWLKLRLLQQQVGLTRHRRGTCSNRLPTACEDKKLHLASLRGYVVFRSFRSGTASVKRTMAHPMEPPAAAAVPPVPPAAPAAAAPIATPAPRTYRELYSDAANNPPPDRTAGYLSGYRFTADPAGAAVPAPAALRDQTIALSDRQPMAFLALVRGQDDAYEVVILHRMLRYVDAPGDDPSGFNDSVLGLSGDILPHQYPTVDVPHSAFHLVGNPVRVRTVAAMAALLPTWDDTHPILGPYTDVDPETEVVRPRHIQLVPGRYASILIHRRRVRPKIAYQEIVSAIQAQHEEVSCHDVIVWLRAACTARGGGGAQLAVPGVLHSFTPLHLPAEVYQYVTTKVRADLPALATPQDMGGDGGPVAAALLRTLGLARAAIGEEGIGGREGTKAPKTIVEAYKETYATLLRYCNVASSDSVAPVWTRLANCHKSEQHTVLTQELQKVCMARGLSTELYAPVITTTLKQMVVSFQFAGHGVDDLTSGCQPFLVAYSGSANHYLAVASADVGNQLSQGEQNASLSDYRTIREKEKLKFPRDISEVCITLTRFAVLAQCLFQGAGPKHPFVEAMWSTVAGFKNGAPFITERFHALTRHPGIAALYHAQIVRAVQLGVYDYMQMVASNVADGVTGVEIPSFTSMLQELRRGTFQNSTNWVDIPEPYLDPVLPIGTSFPAAIAATASGVSTTATQSTTRTGVSTLTAETRTSVTRVDNPAGDAEFASITMRLGGARNLMREHRPPSNDAGSEFCVAWWTRGGCFPNCGRRATHVPFASAGERTRLLSYVRTHLQAPAAAGAGASA